LTNSVTPLARFSGSDGGFFFILPTPGYRHTVTPVKDVTQVLEE
jgi:hypothetical protein